MRILKYVYYINGHLFSSLLIFILGTSSLAYCQKDTTAHSPTKGFLFPQMTTEQRNAMVNKTEGMVIYNLSEKKPQFYNGTEWKYFDRNNHFLGETFGGGIVFFIDSTGDHGMVVATSDQGSAPWGNFEKELGAHGKIIGAGKSNTEIITKAHPKPDFAAGLCSNLESNGYSDWHLPSIEELKMIYQNIHLKGMGNFASEEYWSSTETDFNNAWQMDFGRGVAVENNEVHVLRVRAIRYF